ncbi:MAG: copper chaperone PCu(A)C [Candidatus Dactylopiibacterium sp.]|nr:copper chaperone PCu(A)C [Candidatus Dactylopiibacterium sp.]
MKPVLAACILALLSLPALGEVSISKPWAKGTLASATSSAVYLELQSTEAGAIVAASSPRAQSVEMFDMRFELDGGPLKPVKLDEIPFEARRKLQLSPVTMHFVLRGLQGQIRAGERVPLVLRLRMAGGDVREVRVEAVGRGLMP